MSTDTALLSGVHVMVRALGSKGSVAHFCLTLRRSVALAAQEEPAAAVSTSRRAVSSNSDQG